MLDFRVNAHLDAVYNHFHNQHYSRGWQRTQLDLRPNRAIAVYRRGDENMRLILQRRGNSGEFGLEINLNLGDDDDD